MKLERPCDFPRTVILTAHKDRGQFGGWFGVPPSGGLVRYRGRLKAELRTDRTLNFMIFSPRSETKDDG